MTELRNIAIIAHVDHGKTTLVDQLLRQSGTLALKSQNIERIMDSNDLERERGITILAKTTAINWKGYHINIVDTPGHADFGGEVERILTMVDSVLLVVDAVDGPMPQTSFVTQKAFSHGLAPIVVVNKIDRDGARPSWVIDQVFSLFDSLGATDKQLDFPIIYTSALQGFATLDPDTRTDNMDAIFDLIVKQVPPPKTNVDGPFQMQISTLDYSSYVGSIGIGRIHRGTAKKNMPVVIVDSEGKTRQAKILQILGHHGIDRIEVDQAFAGDIVCVTGMNPLNISDTLCDISMPEALPALTVDEPTVSMTFCVNDSPFAGREGKYVTSRQIGERLERELLSNVALRVKQGDTPDKFIVSGRGELHLSILIENMRREGFELAVSRPEIILKEIDGVTCEPFESVIVTVDQAYQGTVMEMLGARQGQLKDMIPENNGRFRLSYIVPSRGLIGFHTVFLTETSGTGILHHTFDHYGPMKTSTHIGGRHRGAMIANMIGKAIPFSMFNLQERGNLITSPGDEVYEGMIVGIHSRDNDLVVNICKTKQLTNVRASGSDENIILTPPAVPTLEQALEMINDDELVEITPKSIRLRKKRLKETDRKRSGR